jgi:hypothetical protein
MTILIQKQFTAESKTSSQKSQEDTLGRIIYEGSTCPKEQFVSGLEWRECAGCGRRFLPTGPQRYCDHACYSASLRVGIEHRFWTKVNKNGPIPAHCQHLGPCWVWTAGTFKQGYGQIGRRINGKAVPAYAHRLSWEFAYGAIPDGLGVLHKCDVPRCVRPEHLFLGTRAENLADARQKGRLDESRPRTKTLTLEDRLAIYHARQYRGVQLALAREYGVSKTCINLIRKGRFAGCPNRVHVPVGGDVRHVKKHTTASWSTVKPEIGKAS